MKNILILAIAITIAFFIGTSFNSPKEDIAQSIGLGAEAGAIGEVLLDVVIPDVPEEAVDEVKEMASTAIERYYKRKDLRIDSQTQADFEIKVDAQREKMNLLPKFREIEEIIEIEK